MIIKQYGNKSIICRLYSFIRGMTRKGYVPRNMQRTCLGNEFYK